MKSIMELLNDLDTMIDGGSAAKADLRQQVRLIQYDAINFAESYSALHVKNAELEKRHADLERKHAELEKAHSELEKAHAKPQSEPLEYPINLKPKKRRF